MLKIPTRNHRKEHYTVKCETPYKPWKVVIADIFIVNNKKPSMYGTLNSSNSKFPIGKKVTGLLADDLVHMARLIFAEYGLP